MYEYHRTDILGGVSLIPGWLFVALWALPATITSAPKFFSHLDLLLFWHVTSHNEARLCGMHFNSKAGRTEVQKGFRVAVLPHAASMTETHYLAAQPGTAGYIYNVVTKDSIHVLLHMKTSFLKGVQKELAWKREMLYQPASHITSTDICRRNCVQASVGGFLFPFPDL